ncbi:MAG: SusC/RagA family TonB-linked outer membrane protein [Bacteroidales bacterium]|nr:SusC/RagA family TonB-linked outer membrane protein [Bacteroidales bacterium]
MKRTLLLAFVLLFGTSAVFAQKQVNGTVIDASTGETLPMVTVMVKGTTTGTTTTMEGTYSITVPSNESILVFNYMGYETIELPVPVAGIMDVKLKTVATALEGVVITGYQTIVKERATGSVSSVSSTALESRINQSVADNLEGRVAGLVVRNGEMTIRGVGTLNAGEGDPNSDAAKRMRAPLLVVDGLPIEGSIDDLNPSDIESVTVLKDAAAAAIYGARASNGIIVVTTKKAQVDGVTIDASANFTMYQKRNTNYEDNFMLNPSQQVDVLNSYWKAWFVDGFEGADPATNRTSFERDVLAPNMNRAYDQIQYANYQLGKGLITQRQVTSLLNELRKNNYAEEYRDNVLLNQFVQQYNVALRGRSDRMQQSLVLNLRADNGGIIQNNDNRFNISYRGEYKMADWVTADFGVNTVIQRSNSFRWEAGNLEGTPFSEFGYSRLLNDDGSYADHSRVSNNWQSFDPAFRPVNYNALEDITEDRTTLYRNHARYNAGLTFNIWEGLTAQTQFVYEDVNYKRTDNATPESYLMRTMRNEFTKKDGNTISYLIPEQGGRLWSRNINDNNWTARGQVNYNRIFQEKHVIDALIGTEFRETLSKGTDGLLLGYDEQLQTANPILNYLELRQWAQQNNLFYYNNAVTRSGMISNMALFRETWRRFASGYANLTYTYDDKYNVFGSYRKDYANVYGLESKYRGKPLWSVGLSWVASSEAFMKTYKWIDYLKVRGSFGVTGNIAQNLTSIMTGTSLSEISSTEHGNGQQQMVILSPANPYLTWEKTNTTNIGADFAVLNNRFRGSLDWYYKKSDDVFANKILDPSLGFASMLMNNASLFNQGVEVALTYDWFRPKGRDQFSWTSSLTTAYNYNRITNVDMVSNSAQELVGNRFRDGYAVNALWAYQFAGLDDLGRQTYLDQNGAEILGSEIVGRPIDALMYAGQSDPKITMGLDNTFRWKGFTLNILTVYQGGNMMRCLQAGNFPLTTAANPRTMPSYLLRAWTAQNPNTDVPAHYNNAPVGAGGGDTRASDNSDIYVQPADYLKIRNVSLAYNIPQETIKKLGMSAATVRMQLDNPAPLWLKNKVGVDPETISDTYYSGVRTRTSLIFGINVTF